MQQKGTVSTHQQKYLNFSHIKEWVGGIVFTSFIALLGYGLSQLPGFMQIGPLASAIVIAVAYRQFTGYPESVRSGIQFSSKQLLRLAIILYGLRLNLDVVFNEGLSILLYGTSTIIFVLVVMIFLTKWLKTDHNISLLLAVGTGVCGAAAIAAVAPILKAKDEETAISVGMIALVGTVMAIGYTLLMPYLSLDSIQYGIWSGISLHEIAHVALAATPAGQDALAMAFLAKLGRVFLLIPLCYLMFYWMKRKNIGKQEANLDFPWFLIGFIFMSFVGTYVLGEFIQVSTQMLNYLDQTATFILTMAMVGLGLNVTLQGLNNKVFRSLLAMVITSLLLSFFTLWFR